MWACYITHLRQSIRELGVIVDKQRLASRKGLARTSSPDLDSSGLNYAKNTIEHGTRLPNPCVMRLDMQPLSGVVREKHRRIISTYPFCRQPCHLAEHLVEIERRSEKPRRLEKQAQFTPAFGFLEEPSILHRGRRMSGERNKEIHLEGRVIMGFGDAHD